MSNQTRAKYYYENLLKIGLQANVEKARRWLFWDARLTWQAKLYKKKRLLKERVGGGEERGGVTPPLIPSPKKFQLVNWTIDVFAAAWEVLQKQKIRIWAWLVSPEEMTFSGGLNLADYSKSLICTAFQMTCPEISTFGGGDTQTFNAVSCSKSVFWQGKSLEFVKFHLLALPWLP